MKMNKVIAATNVSVIILLLTACAALKPKPAPQQTQTAAVQPASGVQYFYVTNQLMLPTTPAQSQAFALNVDGDPQLHLDNKFGDLLTLLISAAPDLKLQSTLDQAVSTGQLVTLHVVKADDPLNDPSVSWSIYLGQKSKSAPTFDGSDKFTLDSASPANSPIVGSLKDGHFTGGPGAVRVQMLLLSEKVDVDMIGVRLEADVNAKSCANGILAGGVTVEEFRGKLLPPIADGLTQILKTDQGKANSMLQSLDSDKNGTITGQELESNPLLMLAISPDMDLLDASGKFNPGQDGVKDSYSVGLGFTCVPAVFTVPGN